MQTQSVKCCSCIYANTFSHHKTQWNGICMSRIFVAIKVTKEDTCCKWTLKLQSTWAENGHLVAICYLPIFAVKLLHCCANKLAWTMQPPGAEARQSWTGRICLINVRDVHFLSTEITSPNSDSLDGNELLVCSQIILRKCLTNYHLAFESELS